MKEVSFDPTLKGKVQKIYNLDLFSECLRANRLIDKWQWTTKSTDDKPNNHGRMSYASKPQLKGEQKNNFFTKRIVKSTWNGIAQSPNQVTNKTSVAWKLSREEKKGVNARAKSIWFKILEWVLFWLRLHSMKGATASASQPVASMPTAKLNSRTLTEKGHLHCCKICYYISDHYALVFAKVCAVVGAGFQLLGVIQLPDGLRCTKLECQRLLRCWWSGFKECTTTHLHEVLVDYVVPLCANCGHTSFSADIAKISPIEAL